MGNEQSSPAAADSAKNSPTGSSNELVPELNETDSPSNERDTEFNNGLPTLATSDETLPDISPSVPIGILRASADSKDKRPAFLRRLTTAPSAALTAKTHTENVTATPTSPSPKETFESGAKAQLNTVTQLRSATNQSIRGKDDFLSTVAFEAESASPVTPGLDKELAQSLSSLESDDEPGQAPCSGSISPLSFDFVGIDDRLAAGMPTSPSENGFDHGGPASFSVDDWAWRMEFAPSEASEDDETDPEFFPLPDGDDESFADDELSYLEPGRERVLRGESSDDDHVELARVPTTSSAESTEKAASIHVRGLDAEGIVEVDSRDAEMTQELTPSQNSTCSEPPQTEKPGGEKEDLPEEGFEHAQVCIEEAAALALPESPPLQPQFPDTKEVEIDNRRDSAMYQLNFESKGIDQLQTVKEPEPSHERKRMSLASIGDVASELFAEDLQSDEVLRQPDDIEDKRSFMGISTVHTSVLDQTDDTLKETEKVVESQPADDDKSMKNQVKESHRVEKPGGRPVEDHVQPTKDEQEDPQNESPEDIDEPLETPGSKFAGKRPATAHPCQAPVKTSNRPLTAPSASVELSEVLPVREKSKSWRKTWPILGNRTARPKGKEPAQDLDEILPTLVRQKNAQQVGPTATLKSKADETVGPTLVSKIPKSADKASKAKDKKKRSSILGSIFRHHSTTKEDKSTKDKPNKRSSKIAKVYRRSTKRQDNEEDRKAPKSGSANATVLGTQVVNEPEPLKQISINDVMTLSEDVLKDADEGPRSGSTTKGKYALPSASLGIPTLLQSPGKREQSQEKVPQQHWYQQRSATPQPSSYSKPLRRGSMGVAEGANKKRFQSSLPQALISQPQSLRASIYNDPSHRHAIAHPPPRAQPLLPTPDDSPYSRASTGIPQPSTSKIFSYPNRNPPYRGISRTNSSPIQGTPQPPRVVSRIPSTSLSQGPPDRYHVVQRLPGPPRMVDVRRSNTFTSSSRSGSMSPGIERGIPDETTGLSISSSQPMSSETLKKHAMAGGAGPSFVPKLADTVIGERGSEDITMRATSYPGMEWVPHAVE